MSANETKAVLASKTIITKTTFDDIVLDFDSSSDDENE
jgi:hypothetical protein